MESASTISELKSTFIRRQLRVLSEHLEPNDHWRDYAGRSEENLSEKAVEDVLQKGMMESQPHCYCLVHGSTFMHVKARLTRLLVS